jgi:hypothetical protein
MKIKLGTSKAHNYPFKFQIEDKVIYKNGDIVGKIVSGDCYSFKWIPHYHKIFYKIRLLSAAIRVVDQSDLDPLPRTKSFHGFY